jgi:2-polyprenyl-3-methyl-5-hydroxy-6-metoxy-1,4-benzoquinol methylase
MKKCILCGELLPNYSVLNCENMPSSAQDIPVACDLDDEKSIDLELYQCLACGLVQFNCEPVEYYRDVIRSGGYSSTMHELRSSQYEYLISKYNLVNRKFIEVGCGQGEFLEILTQFPVHAYGIENKSELASIAIKKGLNVNVGFTKTVDTKFENGPFDVFLSFNFIEHQPDPNTMIQCIYNNLSPLGYGMITAPSFEYIIENESSYELIRDHIAYYTKDTLKFLMEKNGFEVIEDQRINRDTISLIVRKRSNIDVSGLRKNIESLKKEMSEFTNKLIESGEKVAIWGASHQGFTAISITGVKKNISYIIDSAPFKQGKYAPASHVKIVSPDFFYQEPVESILIIAPGYTDEIRLSIRNRYGDKVKIYALISSTIEFLN